MEAHAFWKAMFSRLHKLLRQECGQDLVEYALLIALVAFAASAGMSKVASGLNTAFSNISKQLSTSIT